MMVGFTRAVTRKRAGGVMEERKANRIVHCPHN